MKFITVGICIVSDKYHLMMNTFHTSVDVLHMNGGVICSL